MDLIDRVALIVTPRRRFLEWANGLPDAGSPLTIEEAKSLRTIFLAAVDDLEPDLQDMIDHYWEDIFEESLVAWTSDESLWPANRTAHVFRDWFQVECIDHVTDADPGEPLPVSERVLTRCAVCRAPLDEIVRVGLDKGGSRRLTPEEAERYHEEAQDAVEDGERRALAMVVRCCSDACASEMEASYARALADGADRD